MSTSTPGSKLMPAYVLPAHERGSTTVFTIGLLALVLATVLLVATSAAVHLERKRLWNFADTVALEISDEITYQGHLTGTVGAENVIKAAEARIFNPQTQQEEFENLTLGSRTGLVGGDQVRVHLAITHRPGSLPWMLLPWSDGIAVEAESVSNFTPPN